MGPDHHRATYLNDHLAGATAGVELAALIVSSFAGAELEPIARELHEEIKTDRHELEVVMRRLGIRKHPTRIASAWLGEKLAALKLRIDDPAAGDLRRLECFEALSIGIEGKRLLWVTLAAAAESNPDLRGTDYPRLIASAQAQRDRIEVLRVHAGVGVFREPT